MDKLIPSCTFIFLIHVALVGYSHAPMGSRDSTYLVVRMEEPIKIDGDWYKPQWQQINAVEITNFILDKPSFFPSTSVKMAYDDENIYIIFFVEDRYVRSVTTEINGPVWKDSAVEFFFSPDTGELENYFNLEINCGGVPLLGYPSISKIKPEIADIKQIEIAHSLPRINDPEITDSINWTIECSIPISMLEKYAPVVRPKTGVMWRANFYKIAGINSNPHNLSWTTIDHPKPTFHLPKYFGTLKFQ